jgi:inosose dehydratase
MYRPLGTGDADFAAIVSHPQRRDHGGWYVLEQDTIFIEEPRGEGPAPMPGTAPATCARC